VYQRAEIVDLHARRALRRYVGVIRCKICAHSRAEGTKMLDADNHPNHSNDYDENRRKACCVQGAKFVIRVGAFKPKEVNYIYNRKVVFMLRRERVRDGGGKREVAKFFFLCKSQLEL
jgi:hypothetical protein